MKRNYTFDESINVTPTDILRITQASNQWKKQKITHWLGEYNIKIHPSEINGCKKLLEKDYFVLLDEVIKEFGNTKDESLNNIFKLYGKEFNDKTTRNQLSHTISFTMNCVMSYMFKVKMGETKPEKSFKKMIESLNA